MSIQGIAERVVKGSTGRIALAGFILFLIFTAAVLPNQASQSEAYTREAGSPDQSFFYSPEDLVRMAESYGPEGRQAYIRARFTFDLIWPLVYLIFLATGLGWLCGKLIEPSNRWRGLVLLPFLGCLFDYLENIAAVLVMGRYPDSAPVAAFAAPIFTLLKWSMIALSFSALLGLLIWFLLSRFRPEPA